jgi:Flp pilus assembly protein TadD
LLLREDVLEYLRRDATLSAPLRQEALALAADHTPDAEQLFRASWDVVRKGGEDLATYRKALRQAEEACRLKPDDGDIVNTLGVAQYRVGQFAKAVETLSRSDKLNAAQNKGSIPGDLAFLAMAYNRLGQKEKAQEVFVRLQEIMKQPAHAKDRQSQDIFREAEKLMQGRAKSDQQ